MSLLFLKSILAIVMTLSVFVAIVTMFEVVGRSEKKFDVGSLKKIHKVNGVFFLLLFFFITYDCLRSVIHSQAELSARGAFHAVFAIAVLVLLGLKISFIEIYRQFFGKVMTIGPVIALISLGMVGTSAGYYLLVTQFHTDTTFDEIMEYKEKGAPKNVEVGQMTVRTDAESVGRGRTLFETRCSSCHDPYGNKAMLGPGLKGILKNRTLPASRRPATPENIVKQLEQPFSKMPSFAYLKREEVADIIAFLNTL